MEYPLALSLFSGPEYKFDIIKPRKTPTQRYWALTSAPFNPVTCHPTAALRSTMSTMTGPTVTSLTTFTLDIYFPSSRRTGTSCSNPFTTT
jgi:hypothetical protein